MSPKEDEPTATVSVRLGENMKKILEAIAYEERRTVSSLLGRLIDNHVKSYDPKTIARALHAVQLRERDAGEVGQLMAIMKEVERLQQPAPPPSPNTSERPLGSWIKQVAAAQEPNIGEPVQRYTVIPLDEPIRAPEGPVGAPQSHQDPVTRRIFSEQLKPSVVKRKQKHNE